MRKSPVGYSMMARTSRRQGLMPADNDLQPTLCQAWCRRCVETAPLIHQAPRKAETRNIRIRRLIKMAKTLQDRS
jgi:hypothetical protein